MSAVQVPTFVQTSTLADAGRQEIVVTNKSHPWVYAISPQDWAEMTRMHEGAHVAASEALGIPVVDVWANPDQAVAHGGQYNNSAGDSQLQCVVYAIGAFGGGQALHEAGYSEDLVEHSITALGYSDRVKTEKVAAEAAEQGFQLDLRRAHHDALAVLFSAGFLDVTRSVAQALADQGDKLTGADVRAAMGDWQLDRNVWVPASDEFFPPPLTREDSDEMEIEL
ncbi:hypothetical protein [Kitasatospora griseola]|uniref:hypothetical protein n=1 Tax=Kitasatospora griseola TaxID=2064 RepID=UPI00364D2754